MNRKILSIVLGAALIAGFFLDYSKGGWSGYDIVFNTPGGSSMWEKYLYLIFPISGAMLLIGGINNDNYILSRSLWALLPILFFIYMWVRAYIDYKDFKVITNSFKGYGIGMWITFVSALVLAIYQPKR